MKIPKKNTGPLHQAFLMLPLTGIGFFVCLYVLATFYYPGGSNADRNSIGFDWLNNYWCDLTGNYAKDGAPNPAQPIAMTALAVLCSALSAFWYQISRFANVGDGAMMMRYPGMASVTGMLLLFTHLHDAVVGVCGALGLLAVGSLTANLQKSGFKRLGSLGIVFIVSMSLNYGIYVSDLLIAWLPLIQKCTFLLFLLWIALVDYHLCLKGNAHLHKQDF